MPTFPQWGLGLGIVAIGVWAINEWNPRAAWYLTVLILLGVLLFRDAALTQFTALMETVFDTAKTPPPTTTQTIIA